MSVLQIIIVHVALGFCAAQHFGIAGGVGISLFAYALSPHKIPL